MSVDLKQVNNATFLHIIDKTTRFSVAAAVNLQQKEEIVNTFIKYWIVIFGAAVVAISGNGGNFKSIVC